MILRRKTKCKLGDAYINWDRGTIVTDKRAVARYFNKERNRNVTT